MMCWYTWMLHWEAIHCLCIYLTILGSVTHLAIHLWIGTVTVFGRRAVWISVLWHNAVRTYTLGLKAWKSHIIWLKKITKGISSSPTGTRFSFSYKTVINFNYPNVFLCMSLQLQRTNPFVIGDSSKDNTRMKMKEFCARLQKVYISVVQN